MNSDLATRRRVLLLTYQRYLAVDRAWNTALREMNTWFPLANKMGLSTMGNPGSRIRGIHDRRDRALRQLQAARLKLEVAKQRLDDRRRNSRVTTVLLITCDSL